MKQHELPSDSELSIFAKQFALACREKNCYGMCAVTSPISEDSHSGFCCDFLNGQFLIKNLVQQFAEEFKIPLTQFVAFQALYLAGVEEGAIDEDFITFDFEKMELVLEKLKGELDAVFSRQVRNLQCKTA